MFERVLSLCIRLAALGVFLGWFLSLLGALDGRGYLLAGVPAALVVVMITLREGTARGASALFWRRVIRRGRRGLPLIYWVTFALIACGAVLHEPNNFDGLCYRIPRVLYWLDHHGWYWIDTPCEPVNYTMPNYEWLTVPFYLVTGGFHATVLINWVSFLLLPSLFFTLARAFGSSGRMARDWMWLFPSGYLIVLQAGGIANDLCGLAALMAALHCANRWRERCSLAAAGDALLAIGFCTGVKLSNVPLAPFAGILLLGAAARCKKRLLPLAALTAAALAVSAAIPMWFNFAHTGTVLGASPAWDLDKLNHPVAGLVGNSLLLVIAALFPPVLPGAARVSDWLSRALGPNLFAWLVAGYPKFSLRLNELPQEEAGALGLGITIALCVCAALWWKGRGTAHAARAPGLACWQRRVWWLLLGFALLVVMARLGTGASITRNLLPWYPLALAPVVGAVGVESTARSRLWKACAVLASLSVLPALVLTPSRPLLSPSVLASFARTAGLSTASVDRLNTTYDTYARRADPFAEIRRTWPAGERVIGLVSDGSEPTASWWKPYGSHRCVYLMSDAAVAAARAEGVRYVVIEDFIARRFLGVDTTQWLAAHHARALKVWGFKVLASQPADHYTLATFDESP